jgi:ABC-type amino acid transport system permease subunit
MTALVTSPAAAKARSLSRAMLTRIADDGRVLFGDAWRTVRARRLAAAPLAFACGAVVLVMAWLDHRAWGNRWIARWATEYAGSDWSWFFVRLVPSLFAPTELLPFWLAWIQVTIVLACCEVLIGPLRTAIVGLVCHALATVSARLFIDVGPGWLLGIAESYRFFADTGPSAATIGLGMYVSVVKRTPTLFALLALYAAVEVMTRWGLAQREHTVAVAVGLALGVIELRIQRRRRGVNRDASAPSAAQS